MRTIILSVIAALTLTVAMAQTDYSSVIVKHKIATGMTFANVTAAWGKPSSIGRPLVVAHQYEAGVVMDYGPTEFWFYPNFMVMFENGKVATVQQFNATVRSKPN